MANFSIDSWLRGSLLKQIAAGALLSAISVIGFIHPELALVTIVGSACLVLGIQFPEIALLLYAGTLLFFQVPLASEIKVAIPAATGALLLVVSFLRWMYMGATWKVRSILPRLLLYLGATLIISAAVNPTWFLSRPGGLFTFIGLGATSIAVCYLVRDRTLAYRVVGALVLGVPLIAGLTIYEEWSGNYNVLGLFSSGEDRAYGLADPNYTAALLVTILPFIIACYSRATSLVFRMSMIALVVCCYVGIVLTASRGGVIGAVVTTIIAAWWVPSAAGRHRSWGRLTAFALLGISIMVAVTFAPQTLWDRLQTHDQWTNPRTEGRLRIWDSYLDLALQSPWWGHGPGYLDPDYLEGRENIPHNTPLQMFTEVGFFGATAFLLVNAAAIWESLKARKRFLNFGDSDGASLSGAIGASLIGFNFTAFFLTSATHKELWLILGLAASMHSISRHLVTNQPIGRLPDFPLRTSSVVLSPS